MPPSATLEMAKGFTPYMIRPRSTDAATKSSTGKNKSLALKDFDHEDHSHLPSSPASAAPLRFDDTGA